jgi:hypothetical protein
VRDLTISKTGKRLFGPPDQVVCTGIDDGTLLSTCISHGNPFQMDLVFKIKSGNGTGEFVQIWAPTNKSTKIEMVAAKLCTNRIEIYPDWRLPHRNLNPTIPLMTVCIAYSKSVTPGRSKYFSLRTHRIAV